MPDYCTCGAKLPPDARFCHKCGKPQFDPPPPEEFEQAPVEAPLPDGSSIAPEVLPAPLPIDFRNRLAVRTALLVAVCASFLIAVPLPALVAFFWLLLWLTAAGFVSVYLYHRRSGQLLNLRGGMRMGWLTGLFCFLIAMVLFTVSMFTISSQGGLAAFYRQQMAGRAGAEVNIEEVTRILESPTGLAAILLFTLFFLFVVFTALPAIGGALGAKLLDRE